MKLENLIANYKELKGEADSKFESEQKKHLHIVNGIQQSISSLSSGHAIVLMTISKLISKVEEKTLVLVDEPESHLHPPLLCAFLRALSDLLQSQNGVAILATHSPVVLQEVPKECVFIMERRRDFSVYRKPEIETFGQNVGLLTSQVFGLDVRETSYHRMLEDLVNKGYSFEGVIQKLGDNIGLDGRILVNSLIAANGKKIRG